MNEINEFKLGNVIPGFILKLWKMLNDSSCDDLICWTDDGNSFIIVDSTRFSHTLSRYFKHNNLSSFIRQLNMYGFRKVSTVENCGLAANSDDLHFYHPNFIRGKPQLLELIKRKLPQKNGDSIDFNLVIKDIEAIESKQSSVETKLSELKNENEMLWREIHDLRERHQQQQMFISNLMKFVIGSLNKDGVKPVMALKRKNGPLMIGGSDDDDTSSHSSQQPRSHNVHKRVKFTSDPSSHEQQQQKLLQDLISDVGTALDHESTGLEEEVDNDEEEENYDVETPPTVTGVIPAIDAVNVSDPTLISASNPVDQIFVECVGKPVVGSMSIAGAEPLPTTLSTLTETVSPGDESAFVISPTNNFPAIEAPSDTVRTTRDPDVKALIKSSAPIPTPENLIVPIVELESPLSTVDEAELEKLVPPPNDVKPILTSLPASPTPIIESPPVSEQQVTEFYVDDTNTNQVISPRDNCLYDASHQQQTEISTDPLRQSLADQLNEIEDKIGLLQDNMIDDGLDLAWLDEIDT